MHLVLSHEQADFDAVASLLAARLLESEALAVLPRRLNRNVKAFLDLYGDALPLIEYGDLPRRKVQRITLVDTQNLPQVRGAGSGTAVHVVDHHPPEPQLDPAWGRVVEEVGATTTLLVESLQAADVVPGLAAATLLLLGIYEDTGSLSYGSTTARDVRAAGWLLECGASLAIAAEYLNHPLSPDQRRVYDRLLAAMETHEVQGLTVMLACAEAGGPVEEILTLAHRLRDLFDPAGLFVLVALDGHVQLVARSTTESLDVAQLAQHFGGGGHDRAAAALIRNLPLAEVRRELLARLPECVRPSRTVGEILSHLPQLLDPATPVAEAAQRMLRFGHEGYPVVEQGRVVGLLTRRAVDRALAHGMGAQPVGRVMEAGTLTVAPGDSVEHLQRVMLQHNWGQVPVVEPGSGAIIGIVTRTDLLKTLAPGAGAPAPNLAGRLEARLPPARFELLRRIGQQAERLGAATYLVGGPVRDLLLDLPATDLDLVVEGDAIALARALAGLYGGRTSSHSRFGTAKWRLNLKSAALRAGLGPHAAQAETLPESLDLVSARAEFYSHPTALPSVERGSIKLDLHRRDFTINTLAIRLDGGFFGQLLDPWGGGRDLEARTIRVLHSISFVDDPTRMLRAVRLEQRLGFAIEPRTLELLQEARALLARVSGERIRAELALMFDEPQLLRILPRLHELGLLQAIHPALGWDRWLAARFRQAVCDPPPDGWSTPERAALLYALWLYRAGPQAAGEVCDRLHMPQALRAAAVEAARLAEPLERLPRGVRPSQVVTLLEGRPEGALAAAAVAAGRAGRQAVRRYLTAWRHVRPRSSGDDLRAAGLPPGPAYARILRALRDAWLDGGVSTAAEEAGLLEQLIEEARRDG